METKHWYSVRDDRTDRIQGVNPEYKSASVGIVIVDSCPSYSTQAMIIITLNLLSRWCRSIKVDTPEFDFTLPGYQGKSPDVLNEVAKLSDPTISLVFQNVIDFGTTNILHIGSDRVTNHKKLWINSSGWIAGLGYGYAPKQPTANNDTNVIGAAFASGLGNAELFRIANKIHGPGNDQKWYSLFNFNAAVTPDDLPNPLLKNKIDLGRITQAGCGAIGSSFDYLLALTNWTFDIDLVDFDRTNFPNCSSSLIFSYEDASTKRFKVDACYSLMKHFGKHDVRPFVGDYSEFVGVQESRPDIILCFANENAIWSTIQNNYPPIVLHATTNRNWGTNFGRHLPIKEWCIMCRFEDEIEGSFVPVCGEVELVQTKTSEREILGILPFLSEISATIVLAELAKLTYPGYPHNDNFIEFSTRVPEGDFVHYQLGPKPCYVCKNQDVAIHQQIHKDCKYKQFFSD